MLKLLTMSASDEPKTETPPPTGVAQDKKQAPGYGIALFGFRDPDPAPQGSGNEDDGETDDTQSEKGGQAA